MIFLPELAYFVDQPDFPIRKALTVTATAIARWTDRYEARLIVPKKDVASRERLGSLPPKTSERPASVITLLDWISDNSEFGDLFLLRLMNGDQEPDQPACFDYSEAINSWALNLEKTQFDQLRTVWQKADLPKDLFYWEEEGVCEVQPPGPIARFVDLFGWTIETKRCYSPRQWQRRQTNNGQAQQKTLPWDQN